MTVSMSYLIQILLPLYDNAGHEFDAQEYVNLRTELADRFGGVTAYMRAPARGVWKDDATGETQRDDIVIFEVMTDRLDHLWWANFRTHLEERFRQDTVIVRALNSTIL
jgi:crotonobetainyl-CoA:carnitine CoA-transferase CaiB-like acyl-CoA transferase